MSLKSRSDTKTINVSAANSPTPVLAPLEIKANIIVENVVQAVAVPPVATAGDSVAVTVTVKNNAPAGGTSVGLATEKGGVIDATIGTLTPNPLVIPEGMSSATATLALQNRWDKSFIKVTAAAGATTVRVPVEIKGNSIKEWVIGGGLTFAPGKCGPHVTLNNPARRADW